MPKKIMSPVAKYISRVRESVFFIDCAEKMGQTEGLKEEREKLKELLLRGLSKYCLWDEDLSGETARLELPS
jgi:hypothetical protein